jgi:hypothetical protein
MEHGSVDPVVAEIQPIRRCALILHHVADQGLAVDDHAVHHAIGDAKELAAERWT